MNTSTTALLLVAATAALSACNRPDANRTTSAPAGVNTPTAVMQPLVTPSAPPATADRSPVAASANTAAPGTNAALAFSEQKGATDGVAAKAPAVSGATAASVAVDAQEAAAKAPDTAAADAAKNEVKEGGLRTPGTGTETSANNPRHGELTKTEESNQMPKAGQANNYSSTALEEDSGRGRKP